MTDWIDYCPSCGMEFKPEAKARWTREIVDQWQPGEEWPKPESYEIRCVYGHRFDVSAIENTASQGVRVKLL